jgi:hypothetical protein
MTGPFSVTPLVPQDSLVLTSTNQVSLFISDAESGEIPKQDPGPAFTIDMDESPQVKVGYDSDDGSFEQTS